LKKTRKQETLATLHGHLEDELEWFFGYAESALRQDRVAMLPVHVAVRATARGARSKAKELAQAVADGLEGLQQPHPVVLRSVFTPRRWPSLVQHEFKRLSPIVVRLFGTADPWPGQSSHEGLEQAMARQLASRLRERQAEVEPWRQPAERLFEAAMAAYAAQRQGVTRGS
jgi:hypothetical protein